MTERARPIDGAEGYAFYRRHDGNVELDEINEHLRGIGMREVQPRMLVHYRKLYRNGYASYVTQNRLDLAIAGDTGWVEEIQSRYAEVAQPVPAELLVGEETRPVSVEGLGLATATAVADEAPGAGTPVVLRLSASGIERTAVVVRSDPDSGRIHLRFDLYSSVSAAPQDAAHRAEIKVEFAQQSETMAAISDVLIRLEKVIAESQVAPHELVRVSRVSMSSPLLIDIVSSRPLESVVALVGAVVLLRKQWYEGTGVALDNDAKRRARELGVDEKLEEVVKRVEKATEDERQPKAEDESVVAQLRELGAETAYQELTRRQFFGAVRAAILLPVTLTARVLDDQSYSPNHEST